MNYRQYCGLARSLDLIGDRWTLLIIRELMTGRSRYGDLRTGLPGIASNLLVDRLRRLEADGLVRRNGPDYLLTSRGEALRPVIRELIRWAEPLMIDGPADDHFDGTWLIVALDALLRPQKRGRLELRSGGAVIHVESGGRGDVTIRNGPIAGADATVEAGGDVILGIVTGNLDLGDAVERGTATVEGDERVAASVLRGTTGAVGRSGAGAGS